MSWRVTGSQRQDVGGVTGELGRGGVVAMMGFTSSFYF
jgi:hypothetical protein